VTQIRLSRAIEVKIVVRIIPDPERKQEEKLTLAEFKQTMKDQAGFDTILQRAVETISRVSSTGNVLLKDILSIEVYGPNQHDLTVIDLPGIIYSPPNQMASSLARSYMQKESTIILLVVSGTGDYYNQAVLDWAKELDPSGIRTLGIITKPDLTGSRELEMDFINLALNKNETVLRLDWHVLRNRAYNEMDLTPDERRKTEQEFFANSIWGAKLQANQLGIDALWKRLSNQLIRHIAAEVIKVQERALTRCEESLRQLDNGRDTSEDMRINLLEWCQQSARLTDNAIQGRYIVRPGEGFFPYNNGGELSAREIRSRITRQNDIFAAHMEDWGSACLIVGDGGTQSRKSQGQEVEDKLPIPEVTWSDYLNKEMYPLLKDNFGQELDKPLLVHQLFQHHSRNWLNLATQHVQAIRKICEEFLIQVLEYVWPKQFQARIWAAFIQGKMDNVFKEAQQELYNLNANNLKPVILNHSWLQKKYPDWKAATQATKEGPTETLESICEVIHKTMTLLYEVSISHLC
jgi:hypothetical protein